MTNAIVIEIRSANITQRTLKDGRVFATQQAGLVNGSDFPLPFRVGVNIGEPYPVGKYTLDPACFVLSEYGDLTLGRVKLLPLGGAAK